MKTPVYKIFSLALCGALGFGVPCRAAATVVSAKRIGKTVAGISPVQTVSSLPSSLGSVPAPIPAAGSALPASSVPGLPASVAAAGIPEAQALQAAPSEVAEGTPASNEAAGGYAAKGRWAKGAVTRIAAALGRSTAQDMPAADAVSPASSSRKIPLLARASLQAAALSLVASPVIAGEPGSGSTSSFLLGWAFRLLPWLLFAAASGIAGYIYYAAVRDIDALKESKNEQRKKALEFIQLKDTAAAIPGVTRVVVSENILTTWERPTNVYFKDAAALSAALHRFSLDGSKYYLTINKTPYYVTLQVMPGNWEAEGIQLQEFFKPFTGVASVRMSYEPGNDGRPKEHFGIVHFDTPASLQAALSTGKFLPLRHAANEAGTFYLPGNELPFKVELIVKSPS